SNPANWSTNTVPTSADDAEITLIGSYTVSVTALQAANSLEFNAAGATLLESATGKLTLGFLEVDNGYVELDAANTIGSSVFFGGVLALGKAGALGSGSVSLANSELLATASQTLTNELFFSFPGGPTTTTTLAAAHGKALILNSSLGWS